jgi:N-acetylneuraminic acid mutarotase
MRLIDRTQDVMRWRPPSRARHLALALAALLAAACTSRIAKGWAPKAPLLVPRAGAAAVAFRGDVVLVGGRTREGTVTAAVDAYDLPADAWSVRQPLPRPLVHPNAIATSTQLYVLGGLDDAGGVADCFTTADTLRWQPCASLPTARGAAAVVASADLLYVFGGSAGDAPVADAAVYDPSADAWRTLPPLPEARDRIRAALLGGALHVIGGPSGRVDVFDVQNEAWSRGPEMLTPRAGFALVQTPAGDAITFGGETASGIVATVERYDGNVWTALPVMPLARRDLGGAMIAGVAYLPGGESATGPTLYFDAFTIP